MPDNPVIPEKQLPTRATVTGVSQRSIPTPAGMTEIRGLRSDRSKTHLHAERSPDGKEIRTCEVRMGAVCYRDDTGELRSIDTTVRDLDGEIGVDWAPYRFRLHATGVGFDFTSREGGQVSIRLTGIGGDRFGDQETLKPDIADNIITFRDVRTGCDIVFQCLNERVKTLRILHDANAPRTFEWAVTSDRPELIDSTLTGTDATGKALDLTDTIDGDVITETWAGGDVTYPVEIDPTVTAYPGVGADDGYEASGSSWGQGSLIFGFGGGVSYSMGIRFPSVAIDQGAEITSADVGLNATSVVGVGGAGTLYGYDTDNASQFSSVNLPSAVSRTSASTSVPAVGTTGAKTWNATAIVQEIVDRGGFANGNAIAVMFIYSSSDGNYTFFTDYAAGGSIPYLSITYTAVASGGTSKNLLLLGCG